MKKRFYMIIIHIHKKQIPEYGIFQLIQKEQREQKKIKKKWNVSGLKDNKFTMLLNVNASSNNTKKQNFH